MNIEYKELEPITAAAIYNAGNQNSSCFHEEFQKFLHWASKYHISDLQQKQFYFFHPISFSALLSTFKEHPSWKEYLIEHRFIAEFKPQEKFYSMGNRFTYKYSSYPFRLAVVGEKQLLLIREDGCSFFGSPPVQVADVNKVTEKEFNLLTRSKPHQFTKIKEDQK